MNKGNYIFQFTYIDNEGNTRQNINKINDFVPRKIALEIALQHVGEFPCGKLIYFNESYKTTL